MPIFRFAACAPLFQAVFACLFGLVLVLAAWEWETAKPKAKPLYTLDIGPRVPTPESFPKWTGMVRRTWAHEQGLGQLCAERLQRDCRLRLWQSFLNGLQGETRWAQLTRVNRFVNSFRYRPDKANWGASDYWAAPGEFFSAGGDCEDYAIAKYYSLKTLGFPVEQMRIVVLNDTERRLPHAVLVVDVGPYELVLDSVVENVKLWAEVPHYRPIYSINEDNWFIPRGRSLT